MPIRRTAVAVAGLMALALPAAAQRSAIQPDSAQAEIGAWRFIYPDLFEAPTNVSTGR